MAGDGGALKDINEIKSQFRTREGFYKLLTLSDSQQPNSSPTGFLPPVRVSMVKLQPEDPGEESERVCFNIGRELYFYTYTNIKKEGGVNIARAFSPQQMVYKDRDTVDFY
uniref:WD repeat-containing protein 20 n=1 Tax=Scophthalmus maximus TaxID=52904 RepID=A0A8D3EBA4_SCOMX